MKILFANKFFFPKGGAETVFFQERDFLLGQHIKVVDFSMHHPENLSSEFSEYFVPFVDYRNTPEGFWRRLSAKFVICKNFVHNSSAVKQIIRLVEREKPQIAHLHNIYHQITPAIIPVLRKRGVKVVLTLHDYKTICPNYLMLSGGKICQRCAGKRFWNSFFLRCEQSGLAASFLLALEAHWHRLRKSYENVDIFIAPSRFMAEIVGVFRFGSHKIKVLPNGIDTSLVKPTFRDEEYILYFGRLSREKGIKTLLSAYSDSGSRLQMKVVGSGPLAETLKKDFPQVQFLGFRTGSDLNDLIANSSFVVVPSEWYENCSMVVLEAMSYGKAVVGSRVGGIPEQIEDGETGMLFSLGDQRELAQKIKILSENKELRLSLGKRAREKLENDYSLERHFRGLLRIYDSLLA